MITDFVKEYFVWLCVAFAVWNFIVFYMYGIDKRRAKLQLHRISEKALLTSAFLLGGIGAFFGMRTFRHKTKHLKFILLVPVAAALSMAAVAYCGYIIFF